MNFQEILTANGFGAASMVMLLFASSGGAHGVTFSERVYRSFVWAALVMCFLEAISFFIDGQHIPFGREMNLLINAVLYTANVAFAFFWVLFVDYKIFENLSRIYKRIPFLLIPFIIVLVLACINLFTPMLFAVSPDNVFSRLPMAAVAPAAAFLYLVYAEVLIYTSRSSTRNYLFLPSVIFIIPIVIGSVIQMMFYGLSLIWAAICISIVSVYITIQDEASSIDALTGVYARQYLNHWLGHFGRKTLKGRKIAGIMADLDRFKDINDIYGHRVGDTALKAVGKALRDATYSDELVVRYGGDEFVIVKPIYDADEINELTERICHNIDLFNASQEIPCRISLSYGLSYYDPEHDSVDDFLNDMDSAMYENKRAEGRVLSD